MRIIHVIVFLLFVGCAAQATYAPPQFSPPVATATVTLAASDDVEAGYDTVDVSLAGDPVASVDVFFDQLDPYGTWYDDPSYGWVFTPSEVSYIPYANGYWKYTDYGFLWVSYDPFGWATDHYGRWVYQNRWVWVPDTTWGPAWVTWRESNDWIGWAPCGFSVDAYVPDYQWRFVAARDLFATDLHRRYVHDSRTYVSSSKPILRYHRHDRDLWVAGPSEDWMRRRQLEVRRQRPQLDELGRLDAQRRAELDLRSRERNHEWDQRRARTEQVQRELADRVRRQREDQVRLADEHRRVAEDRRRQTEERTRLEAQRRRIESDQARARDAEQRRRIEDERRKLVDEQRRLDDQARRAQQEQVLRRQTEQRRRDDEARRQRTEQDRVRVEQQRRIDEQRRASELQRIRQVESQRAAAEQKKRDDARKPAPKRVEPKKDLKGTERSKQEDRKRAEAERKAKRS